MGLIPSVVLALASLTLLARYESPIVVSIAWGLALSAFVLGTLVLWQWLRPRIGYAEGHVLFYLRPGSPIAVPVEVVEAFFLGQGPANLPIGSGADFQTVNLVARLSQKEPQWAQRDVKPALGKWCEGYVSIRGTWCEPLTEQLIRRLNRRLREVSEAHRAAKDSETHAAVSS